MKKQEKLRIDLTDEQKKKVENVIGRQPEAIELDVEPRGVVARAATPHFFGPCVRLDPWRELRRMRPLPTPQKPTGLSCPACSAAYEGEDSFCRHCGIPLGSMAESDRRIITVLFADLRGFTQLTEQLDAEEVRELVVDCLDPLCAAVDAWGGFVDKLIGDCVTSATCSARYARCAT
jgi:hypothetical protein